MSEEKSAGEIFDWSVLRKIYKYLIPYKGTFYFLVFLTLLTGVLAPTRPYFIQYTVDNHILLGDFEGLWQMTVLLIALALLQGLIQFGQTYLSEWLGHTIILDIRTRLYAHITHLRLQFFDKTPIGRLVTRNISDVEALSSIFSEGLASIVGDLLQLIFIVSLMFYTNWQLTLISMAALPLLIGSTYVFKEKIKSAFNDVRTAVSNLNTFVQEHITGMSVVQIFNSEARELKKFTEINRQHRRAHLRSVLYYSIYFPVAEVIGAMGTGFQVQSWV